MYEVFSFFRILYLFLYSASLLFFIFFMSYKDNDEERVMHSKSDNIEIIINNKANQLMETSMKGIDFIFYCVYLLY